MVGQSLTARALAAALLIVPLLAHAAGLGKLSVLSALGRPLNAEIEVLSLQPGELDSLSARLASNEAFRQAGVEYNPALLSLRFAIERRGGSAIVKLTSSQPINEPFLDLLVELQWASGRLVREYTFLLDPPGYAGPQVIAAAPAPSVPQPVPSAPPPAEVVPVAPVAAAPAPEPTPAPSPPPVTPDQPAAPEPAPQPLPPAAADVPAQPEAQSRPVKPDARIDEAPLAEERRPEARAIAEPEQARSYRVNRGDTLSEIAAKNLPAGVALNPITLNQMMIALFRSNKDAFIRDNINLVRTGRILAIPNREQIATLDAEEARQLVLSHAADFSQYRRNLAAAAERSRTDAAAPERTAAGRIEVKPAAVAPAAPKDELKLAKADPKDPAAAASRAAREDDIAARERALQEAQSRVADLEKNVADLRKLLELKNQQMAELEKKASAKAPEAPKPAAVVPPVAAAKTGDAKPAATPPLATTPETVKPAAEAPKPSAAPMVPEAAKPAVVATPAPAPAAPQAPAAPAAKAQEAPKAPATPAKAPESAPKPAPQPKPPAAAEPMMSFVDEFLENPMALGGLGLVAAILVGYGAWAWRRQKASRTLFRDSVLGPASSASGVSSVFGPGHKPGTAPSSVVLPSVSQTSTGGMETDEVDPIAEADVYMAYGRDGQAEEILKEALEKNPNRTPLHDKLLEIYANRRDAKSFEQTALKLKEITGGVGGEWDKAVALGRSIDADNSLYGGSGRGAAPAAAPVLDFDLNAAGAESAQPDLMLGTSAAEAGAPGPSVDIDLGIPGATEPALGGTSDFTGKGTLIIEPSEAQAAGGPLDFDLGTTDTQKTAASGLDFELPSPDATRAPAAEPAPATADAGRIDFDLEFDLGEMKSETGAGPAGAAGAGQGPLDLSAISLDLGGPAGEGGLPSTDPKWQEVATKLDLAKAYEEMGDKSGASELLNEVLREGDSAQKSQAQQLLAKLA